MSDTQIILPKKLKDLLRFAEDKALLEKCLNTIAAVYRSQMLKRYERFAAGGGDWKPLSKATIQRRRKGKGTGSDRILIDTAGLIHAVGSIVHVGAMVYLTPHVGAKNTINGSYITVGFSSASHDGGETYNTIAALHQNGGWTVIAGKKVFVPQRKILVPPDNEQRQLLSRMVIKVIMAEKGLNK
ncbi:MAG: hypothetical protein IJQ39_02005 [Thermoguttaceae bacterium]|nr:hypothetical protein [Thermoguttaceae bacterium]